MLSTLLSRVANHRTVVARRTPRAFAAIRMFNGRTEGTVAQSKGFKYVGCLLSRVHPRFLRRYFWVRSKKEKAHEGMWFLELQCRPFYWCHLDEYIHRHEQEQLAKMKAEVRISQAIFILVSCLSSVDREKETGAGSCSFLVCLRLNFLISLGLQDSLTKDYQELENSKKQ